LSFIDEKEAPTREARLGTCIEYGGSACELKRKFGGGCLKNNKRAFGQGSICQLLPALAILNTLRNAVVIVHGAIGCGGASHTQSASLRLGQIADGDKNPQGALWLSTNLGETDVIAGGEAKLRQAIRETDRRYRPQVIVVLSTCIPGIIGDDLDSITAEMQAEVNAVILPVHCEGFKTKVMATAYDAIFHAAFRNLVETEPERTPVFDDALDREKERIRRSKLVNLLNVSSMTGGDQRELVRLLNNLGLEVNVFPCEAKPESFQYATQAALSISVCPTHDDYFLTHLQEKYGVPYIHGQMPIGMDNTSIWLRQIAQFFGLEAVAEKIIAKETHDLKLALTPFQERLTNVKVMISAGEVRTLATAVWLQELGLEVVAVRPYHFDRFGEVELEKLVVKNPDIKTNVATVQPFEAVNLIARVKPEVYLGHVGDNVWAAKAGVSVLPIYGGPNVYNGYAGAYDIARRITRLLKNTAFVKNLHKHVRQPYWQEWFSQDPFKYIKQGDIEA
jgi:nitrogenase molybdenum-iron protein alpha chain